MLNLGDLLHLWVLRQAFLRALRSLCSRLGLNESQGRLGRFLGCLRCRDAIVCPIVIQGPSLWIKHAKLPKLGDLNTPFFTRGDMRVKTEELKI